MTDKAALRLKMRSLRRAYAEQRPPPIPSPAGIADLLRPDMIVATYLPMISEADPALLVDAARLHGCTIALPHVEGRDTAMTFRRFVEGGVLEKSDFGMRQPLATSPTVIPDLIFIPLVAFTVTGDRLGQGAGHYDRALNGLPALRIGVGWAMQCVDSIPTDLWDMPLDAVITEEGMITP
jgi:5-formyltetrahydrofolate cyclo-ligase